MLSHVRASIDPTRLVAAIGGVLLTVAGQSTAHQWCDTMPWPCPMGTSTSCKELLTTPCLTTPAAHLFCVQQTPPVLACCPHLHNKQSPLAMGWHSKQTA